MTIIKDISEISDRFYSNFLLRDLVYIVSGMLIILTLILPLNIFDQIDSSWLIVLLIFLSYYIGLINQEFWVFTGLIRMYPIQRFIERNFIEQEKNSIIISINAINTGKIKAEALKKLEKIKVIKNSTAGNYFMKM